METSLDAVKAAFHRWFFIPDDTVIDLIFSVVVANRFEDEPIWLFLVAPPSNMKTEFLLTLKNLPDAFFLSKLTSKTLLSGRKDPNASLLKRLEQQNKKMLVLKDFTTILSMSNEERNEIYSQLREIVDGHLSYSTGGGAGDIEWHGHLGMLAGVTDVIDNYDSVHNALGSRFLYFRLKQPDSNLVATAAERNVGRRTSWREDIMKRVETFFLRFYTSACLDIAVPDDQRLRLVELSCFTAKMRTGVARENYQRLVLNIPQPEGPGRLSRQFSILARAIALVRGRREVNRDDVHVIEQIATGTVSLRRMMALRVLYGRNPIEKYTTRDLALELNFPVNSTREILEDMCLLNLVERSLERQETEDGAEETYRGHDTRAYVWRLDADFRRDLDYLELFPRPTPPVEAHQEELTL